MRWRDIKTTNVLLLLILLVLLAGFGFLVPILWIVAAVIAIWFFIFLVVRFFAIFKPHIRWFIVASITGLIGFLGNRQEMPAGTFFSVVALISFFCGIGSLLNRRDAEEIERKYKRTR